MTDEYPAHRAVPVPESASAADGAIVTLRDGRRVLIRPVRGGDGAALAAAFQRLSPESQRQRFGSAPHALGLRILRQLVDEVDGVDHVAFAAFLTDDPDYLVGVGRILRYPTEPDTLDVGITVAEDYRGTGLGRILGELLAAHRPRPARIIRTQIAASNKPAMALLAIFGGSPRQSGDGDLVIEVND
jgi:RimJ/RimL family protein N-acetyltransferase